MGLDVVVVDKDGENIHHFSAGGYSTFHQFRFELIERIRGKKCGEFYRNKIKAAMMAHAMSMIQGLSGPSIDALEQRLTDRNVPSGMAKEPDLDLIIMHSDCDGDFSTKECEKLYKLFMKHSKKFKDSEFKSFYDDFKSAFNKAAKSGGKVVFK